MCESPQDPAGTTSLSRRRLLGAVPAVAGVGLVAACSNDETAAAPTTSPPAEPTVAAERDQTFALVPLGVQGGPPPSVGHFGISTALVVNGSTYLIDCGRGSASQYFRSGLAINSLAALFLTHMHVDHTIDYPAYVQLCNGFAVPDQFQFTDPVAAYGPGPLEDLGPAPQGTEWASPTQPGTVEMTELVQRAFAGSTNLFQIEGVLRMGRSALLQAHDIDVPTDVGAGMNDPAPDMEPFVVMEDDNVRVTAVLVPHGRAYPSFAYRFDSDHGSVTFSGDTARSDNLLTLAEETDVLVHEAFALPDGLPPEQSAQILEHNEASHTNIADVGEVARDSGAKRLVISHYGPQLPDDQWAARLEESCASAGFAGEYQLASDGVDVDTS